MSALISGSGYCLGERVIPNQELETFINTSDEFIQQRTGIETRRYVKKGTSNADIAVVAANNALQSAGINMADIDMLMVNTLSPDHHDPSQACLLMPRLGAKNNIPAFDIRAQCSGALYGMDIARQYIETKRAKHILVVCSEVLSKRLDPSDEGRNLAILLSDGAGAFIVSASEKTNDSHIVDLLLQADGEYFDLLSTKSPGTHGDSYISEDDVANGLHQFRMNGAGLFEHAVASMCQVVVDILARNQLSLDDIDLVIPHQPNLRLLEAVFKQLGIPEEKAFMVVTEIGNMASAAWPVAYAMAQEQRAIPVGSMLLFLTYGSGATWGAALYKTA